MNIPTILDTSLTITALAFFAYFFVPVLELWRRELRSSRDGGIRRMGVNVPEPTGRRPPCPPPPPPKYRDTNMGYPSRPSPIPPPSRVEESMVRIGPPPPPSPRRASATDDELKEIAAAVAAINSSGWFPDDVRNPHAETIRMSRGVIRNAAPYLTSEQVDLLVDTMMATPILPRPRPSSKPAPDPETSDDETCYVASYLETMWPWWMTPVVLGVVATLFAVGLARYLGWY